MQDKELDQLFKTHLEDAEIQPSGALWSNIEAELEPKRKRRSRLPLYWMAAAVAVVVGGIGLLMPETETIRLQAPAQVAENNSVPSPVVNPSTDVIADRSVVEREEKSTPLVIAPRLTAEDIKKSLTVMQPLTIDKHPIDKDMEMEPVKSPLKAQVREDIIIANADVVPDHAANVITEAEQPERRGIRNVGDLVNYVVDKVDKRDHKVVKFNTDEDDNSSLIAINIGFIKLNSKRHK